MSIPDPDQVPVTTNSNAVWIDPNYVPSPPPSFTIIPQTYTVPNTVPNSGAGLTITSGGSGTTTLWTNGSSVLKWAPILKKEMGQKCDVLADFFGIGIHALLIMTESQSRFIPFMNKFGMIMLQSDVNSWTAFDRDIFHKFIEDETATTFTAEPLTRDEVLKLFADPNNK